MKAIVVKDNVVLNVIDLHDDWVDPRLSSQKRDNGKRHWMPPAGSVVILDSPTEQVVVGALYDPESNTFTLPTASIDEPQLLQQATEAARRVEDAAVLAKYLDDPDAPAEVKQYKELIDSKGV